MQENGLFVRPNLKGFLIGGVFVLAFHCVMQQIEGTTLSVPNPTVPVSVVQWNEGDYLAMLDHVTERPTSEGYYKLGAYFEKQKDFKRAKIFLRKAEALSELDDDE
ncbi:MAG TPA: hypothetical protein DCM86_20015 [Verrucomicrobiales bacterium]|nr:hypothetical protein [Verrucomicrobiales bacterium]